MIILSRIPFLKRINHNLVNRLVAESLEKTRDIYEQKIRMMEQKYRKEIKEIEQNHQITFQQYKKEQENLVTQIMNRAEDIKKEAEKEKKKAVEIHREAIAIKEKFSKLLFKVKTLYNGIDSIMKSTVIAEAEIVNLIGEVDKDMSFRNLDLEQEKEKNESRVKQLKNASNLSLN